MNNHHLPHGRQGNKLFQMIQFIRQPIAVFENCKKAYGKTFTLRLLGHPNVVVISEAAHLKQVFSANSEELLTGKINATLLEPILGNGSLLTLDGQNHVQHRRLLLPSFHGQRMEVYGELMANVVKKHMIHWKNGLQLKLLDEARHMTFSIILSTIFGMEEDDTRFKNLTDSLHALIQALANPFAFMTLLNPLLRRNLGPLTPWAKIMKLKQAVDACLFEEIEARRKINLDDRIDILSLLLQTKDEFGNAMTNQEIRDEMLTLLMAGHETSTMGITWAFYGILSNPTVLQKLKEELNTVIEQPDELVQKLDKLTYLDAVLKEALRVTPVIPYVVRVVKKNYQLGEYTLPEGASIMPCLYLAHRDPDIWHDPDKFIPERFLNTSETPYTYLPFGSGIRRCIGAAFAQYEMKIIIAQILLHTELVLQKGYVPKLERKGVVIAPSNGLPIRIQSISTKVYVLS